MDGLFPTVQGPIGQHDVQLVEQALIEISALKPEHNVFLVGTTNYPDRVDSRILRGGRFREKIEIGVPDEAGYRRLLARYLGKAQLADGLTAETIIRRVQGVSPADLEATINTMKRIALRRTPWWRNRVAADVRNSAARLDGAQIADVHDPAVKLTPFGSTYRHTLRLSDVRDRIHGDAASNARWDDALPYASYGRYLLRLQRRPV